MRRQANKTFLCKDVWKEKVVADDQQVSEQEMKRIIANTMAVGDEPTYVMLLKKSVVCLLYWKYMGMIH